MNYKIPISKPYLQKNDLKEIIKCFNSSWISSKSPWVSKFEQSFAKNISKTKYALALNSGTSALFLALKVLGVKKDDEIIIPSLTMIATINAIILAGAKPVLVDCQSKDDFTISIDDLEKKITKKTKAVIPVHLYGYVCQIDKILEIAKKHKLYVIEDSAEAMGSIYQDKFAGSFSDISCFSLYVNKIITTGNGGILATNNKIFYQLAKRMAFFDFNSRKHFKHKIVGYNLVLSGLNAALGYSQIEKFKKLLSKRRKNFFLYKKYLGNNYNIKLIQPKKEESPNFWFPVVIFISKKIKNKVIKALKKEKIEIREFFLPLHKQPVYQDLFKNEKYPNAEYFYYHGILLPSYYDLKEKEIKFICQIINKNCL